MLDDAYLMLAMDQFKDIRGFTNYASRLPVGLGAVLRGVLEEVFNVSLGKLLRWRLGPKRVRVECCDSELVQKYGL